MSGTPSVLFANPWLAIAAALTAFLALFVVVQLLSRSHRVSREGTRKIVHTGSGLLTLTFPFLFEDVWPVALLTLASAGLLLATKFVPPLRRAFGGAVSGVTRTTLGEIYFPVAVVWLFWMTRDQDPLLFVVPILVLTLADATGAIVGLRYGLTKYEGASKSLEGSVAFAVVAFVCVHVPILLWSDAGRLESLLIAATLALVVMLLEGSAWRGLDNLFIPVGGYFLLRVYLTLDADQLAGRLAFTVALVGLMVAARRSTTLEDDSLLAGAFLFYITWALMGWIWILPPLTVFVGYKWLSPVTPDNSRRMHGVAAVLSIWAPAVAWLAVARATNDETLFYPFTVVFAAHLAIFGLSRLAHQFQDAPLPGLGARAVATSWAIVLVPYLLALGPNVRTVVGVALALPALAASTAVFASAQPDIRDTALDARRWIVQAGVAWLAATASWLVWVGGTRVFE